jgi:GntR family transcriptional regulator
MLRSSKARQADQRTGREGAPAESIFKGSAGTSRYSQLASVLRQRIVGGEWPVGHRLPTVEELARQYGLAKITVRQALAILAEEKLTVSERGRGTHVRGSGAKVNSAIRRAINDVTAGAGTFEIRILEKSPGASLPLRPDDEGEPFPDYTLLRKLHLYDGEPFCLAEFYIATEIFRKFPRGAENKSKIVHLIGQLVAVEASISRQTLTVEPAGYEFAQLLGYPFAAPVAKIRHNLCDRQKRIMSIGSAWYRGDKFTLDIKREQALAVRGPRRKG